MAALYSQVCSPVLGGKGPLAEGRLAKSKCTHDRVTQTLSVFILGGEPASFDVRGCGREKTYF